MLDRVGPGNNRIRGWIEHNEAGILYGAGDFSGAVGLLQKALSLKEEALGGEHPDVALSLSDLALTLSKLGKHSEALVYADRAMMIVSLHGGVATNVFCNRGEILRALGRTAEAKEMFVRAMHEELGERELANSLTGLGLTHLDLGQLVSAVSVLERALGIRERVEPDPTLVAETRFGLARALTELGRDRTRSLHLARLARRGYVQSDRASALADVEAWLTLRGSRVK
jgi:tetratricopeptide (TPR) repeat protein